MNHFEGRDAEILRLEEYFFSNMSSLTRRRVFVLYGLGGIGKTQLSIEFARRHCNRYSAVLWLDGSSKDRLKQSFADITQRLPHDEVSVDVIEGLQDSKVDIEKIIANVLQWLSLPSNPQWLLIIDNVEHDYYAEVRDPQAYDIKQFFPPVDHGSILVTTRLASLERYGAGLKVEKVEDDVAMKILGNNAGRAIQGTYCKDSCIITALTTPYISARLGYDYRETLRPPTCTYPSRVLLARNKHGHVCICQVL